jgi:hypothetical protein
MDMYTMPPIIHRSSFMKARPGQGRVIMLRAVFYQHSVPGRDGPYCVAGRFSLNDER